MEKGKKMEPIPTDLVLDIFTRLPSKSVAKFRILSKYWASTLRSPNFTKLFLTRSSTRPRLLFAVERYHCNEWQFFSTHQPHNPYETSSHFEFHAKFSGDVSHFICSYASGLIYFPLVRNIDVESPLICNPITGMYQGLAVRKYSRSRGFLGFDPLEKQFKVLDFFSILTLGSGELNWRTKDVSSAPLYHRSSPQGICINGILYYLAETYIPQSFVIVRFDVRSEEFNFIDAACFNDHLEAPTGLSLVNYKGKLAVINCKCADTVGRRTVELCMSVLEDERRTVELCVSVLGDAVEKQEWVKYVYILPENEVLGSCDFKVAGVTATSHIVLCMKYTCKPYYVFYFNPEKNTLQSVEIQGFGAKLEEVENRGEVYAFVDYVEDLSLNDSKQLNSRISHVKSLCSCCKKLGVHNNIEEEMKETSVKMETEEEEESSIRE